MSTVFSPPYANTVLLFGRMVNREAMAEFKRQYLAAVAAKIDVFDYQGQEVFVPFAKYLVEFAESQMGVL